MANGFVSFDSKNGLLHVAGQTFKLTETREGDRYDSVDQASGLMTAGTELVLFRDLANKNTQDTSFKTARRVPQGEEFVISRIGAVLAQTHGGTMVSDDDIIKLAYAGVLEIKVNTRIVWDAPIVFSPAGYGVTGMTNRTDTGVVTNGVASYAASPNLLVPQVVTGNDDIDGRIHFPNNSWLGGGAVLPTLDGRCKMMAILHGIIKQGLGR